MQTQNLKVIWTDLETGESKEVYNFNLSPGCLWALNEHIFREYKLFKTNKAPVLTEAIDYFHEIEQYQKSLIIKALNTTGWNKKAAARLLSMNRPTLQEAIKRLGITQTEIASNLISPEDDLIKTQIRASAEDLLFGDTNQ